MASTEKAVSTVNDFVNWLSCADIDEAPLRVVNFENLSALCASVLKVIQH